MSSAAADTPGVDDLMMAFLLTKPRPRIVGRVCQSPYHEHTGGCKRPVWMDFERHGEVLSMCSRCWHLDNALHGSYATMGANPAAARLMAGGKLNQSAVDQLTFPAEWLDG